MRRRSAVGGAPRLSAEPLRGDAEAPATAELRIPLGRTLLTGAPGVLGFADAARVWFNGQSDGELHTVSGRLFVS